MKTLNIIGCGRAARTLARLWSDAGSAQVQDVLTRATGSARDATRFIGGGRAVASLEDMRAADLWMLGVPDTAIASVATALAVTGHVRGGDGVFHLSGFTASTVLDDLAVQGACTASAHPVLSFADPAVAIRQFDGALIGVEGEAGLVAQLGALFAAIGGECFAVDAGAKPLYHAGAVFASNFLVVIIDVARRAYREAGVHADVAERLLAPLARKTLDNVLHNDAASALTGPAARGDHAVLAAQLAVVRAWDRDAGDAYAAASTLALRIAGHPTPR